MYLVTETIEIAHTYECDGFDETDYSFKEHQLFVCRDKQKGIDEVRRIINERADDDWASGICFEKIVPKVTMKDAQPEIAVIEAGEETHCFLIEEIREV